MHAHRLDVRRAQDLALRDSLAVSSLSALTLVVVTLLAARLLGPDLVIRDWGVPPGVPDEGDRGRVIYVPLPPAPAGPAIPGVVTAPSIIVPVDAAPDRVADLPLAGPRDAAVGGGEGPGPLVGEPGGTATSAAPTIPPPTIYIPHDEIPIVVRSVLPEYPGLAREAGMEGRVRVRAFVGVDGRVLRAEAEGAPSVFDAAAVEAVGQWVFTPAKANGQPVAVWVRVPVAFRLR